MKTEQIALVLAIARERSISKAAESLFISQPNASNMLKSLENELGYRIFDRTRAGIVPTAEGTEFIDYAVAIERSLNSISQIKKPVKHIDFKVFSLKFGISEIAFEKLSEKYLTGDYDVDLSYQTFGHPEDALRMVETGNGDLAIVLCRKSNYELITHNAANQDLETTHLGDFQLELICRKGHPIIEGGMIHFDLFEQYTCFSSISVSSSELYAPYFLTKYGIKCRSSLVMDPCESRYRLLLKSDGFLISSYLPSEIKQAYGLESIPIDDSDITVYAIYRNDPQKENLIREYINNCLSLIKFSS